MNLQCGWYRHVRRLCSSTRAPWIVADMDKTLVDKRRDSYPSFSESPCFEPMQKWFELGGNLLVVTSDDGHRPFRQSVLLAFAISTMSLVNPITLLAYENTKRQYKSHNIVQIFAWFLWRFWDDVPVDVRTRGQVIRKPRIQTIYMFKYGHILN